MMIMKNWKAPKVYAVKHRDETTRAASRSGGIFTAISDSILAGGGVVYGCVMTSEFEAVHLRTEDSVGRNLMRGSKYIQSRLGDTYKNVKTDLTGGRNVLFTGTSCQVAGLREFLGDNYDNLLCVDIICHGVPSPAVWMSYIRWQEEKTHSKIVRVDFRNKLKYGWREHIESLIMQNGREVDGKLFANLFYGLNILRPCCYECPFKSVMHPGDITIGDYWGIENVAPEFDDNKGVSLVLVNNDVGAAAFEKIKENILWKKTRIEDSMQQPLKAPYAKPDNREKFWEDFHHEDFEYIAKRYSGYGTLNNLKRKVVTVKKIITGVIVKCLNQ